MRWQHRNEASLKDAFQVSVIFMDCTYKPNKVSIGQSIITGCYTGGTATSAAPTPPALSSSPIGNHDSYVDFISEVQDTHLSLRDSAF